MLGRTSIISHSFSLVPYPRRQKRQAKDEEQQGRETRRNGGVCQQPLRTRLPAQCATNSFGSSPTRAVLDRGKEAVAESCL